MIRNILLSCLVLISILILINAKRNLIWTKQFGGSGNDIANSVTTDSNNFVYVAGTTSSGVTLDGINNAGGTGCFLVKFDTTGNKIWTKQFGSLYDDQANSITTDSNNFVYVAGSVGGSLDGNVNSSLYPYDAFLGKFDSTGNKIWTQQFGSSLNDWANSVTTDSNNFVYVAGCGGNSFNGFLVKFDSSGNKLWTKLFKSSNNYGSYHDEANSVTTDSNNFVYVAGLVDGILDGNISAGSVDAFVIKFDSEGNKMWSKQFGTSYDDIAYSVTTDSNNFIYVAGQTLGSFDKDTNLRKFNAFLVKFDSTGNKLWTRQFGNSNGDIAYSVMTDSNNFVYVAGQLMRSFDRNTNVRDFDAFLVKYDSAGNEIWTEEFGSSKWDQALSVTIDSNNFFYVAGWTLGSFDGFTNVGGRDAFLFKFSNNVCQESCLNCTLNNASSTPTCTTCASGYYKKAYVSFPTECYNNPPPGFFLKNSEYAKCHSSCLTCNSESASECLSCASDFSKKPEQSFPTECYANNAPIGETVKDNQAIKCFNSCLSCVSWKATDCLSCQSGFFKKAEANFPTECFDTAPLGYYLSNGEFIRKDALQSSIGLNSASLPVVQIVQIVESNLIALASSSNEVSNLAILIDLKIKVDKINVADIYGLKSVLGSVLSELTRLLESKQASSSTSVYDLINSKLILSQADQLMNQNNISNGTQAAIFYSNNSVKIQLTNETILTNKVNPDDISKEGLVPLSVVGQIKQMVDTATKTKVEQQINSTVNNSIINNNKTNSDNFYSTDTFTVQIFDNNYNSNQQNSTEMNDLQIQKGLSIVEYDDCSLQIRRFYNFTSEVLVAKIDYDPKLESKAAFGDVSIRYYSPINGELLPAEEICANKTIKIRFPLADVKIEKDEYNKYKENGFNIYDSNSKYYKNRCSPLVDITSGEDITLIDRLQRIYRNISINCGGNCLFNEIDVFNYTVCECILTKNSKAFVENIIFNKLSFFNFDIVACFENLTFENLKNNKGFILITIFTFLSIALSVLYSYFIVEILISKCTYEQIIFYDAKNLLRKNRKETEALDSAIKETIDNSNDKIIKGKTEKIKNNKKATNEKNNLTYDLSIKRQNFKFDSELDSPPLIIDDHNDKKNQSMDKLNNLNLFKNKVNLEDFSLRIGKRCKNQELDCNLGLKADEDIVHEEYVNKKKTNIINGFDIKIDDEKLNKSMNQIKQSTSVNNLIHEDLNAFKEKIRKNNISLNEIELQNVFNDEKQTKKNLDDIRYKNLQNNNLNNKNSIQISFSNTENQIGKMNYLETNENLLIKNPNDLEKNGDSNHMKDKNYKYVDKNDAPVAHINEIHEITVKGKDDDKSKTENENSYNKATLQDYNSMKFDQIVKFDKRNFFTILWHYIFIRYSPISTFFYPSITFPFHLRISLFFLLISLNWLINAILFSDDLIRQRNLEMNKVLISNTSLYSLYSQLAKIIFALLLIKIPNVLLDFLISKSEDAKNKIYDAMLKKDRNLIKQKSEESEKEMFINYLIYYHIFGMSIIFCLYYSTIFCSVYKGSSKNWLIDGFFGIILDYLSSFLLLVLLTITRRGIIKTHNRFLNVPLCLLNFFT